MIIFAQAKEDWGKETLTWGQGSEKIVLPLFLTPYQGETQDDGMKFSSDGLESDTDNIPSEPINNIKSHQDQHVSLGLWEYCYPLDQGDLDDSILQWQRYVCNISTTSTLVLNHQPQTLGQEKPPINKKVELAQSLEEDWEDALQTLEPKVQRPLQS